MNILSSFTHPHVVTYLYVFIMKNVPINQLTVAIDSYGMENILW